MDFKRILNTEEHKVEKYYVNNRKVSEDKFLEKELTCSFKGMNYNSSVILPTKQQHLKQLIHSYN